MVAKAIALLGTAIALFAAPVQAAPSGYEGDLMPGATVTGTAGGSGWFLNDEAQTDFWQFSGAAGQAVSITGTPLDSQLDLAFSVYRGVSEDTGQFLNNSDWTPEGPDFLDFIFGTAPGQTHSLVGLILPATDVYTIAIGGFFSEAAGPFGYQLSLTTASTPGSVALPSSAMLLVIPALGLVAARSSRSSRGTTTS